MFDTPRFLLTHLALVMLWLTATGASADDAATVGIGGHYRVGCWTGIRYSGGESVTTIETRDGDGVEVEYKQGRDLTESDWGYAIPGSEAAPLLLSGDGGRAITTRFPALGSPSRGAAMIPLEMPWIVVFGDPLGVDEIGANELLNRDALIAVSKPTVAMDLPDLVLGYDGVDMMMINAGGIDLLESLDQPRRDAIRDWILRGGRIFVTLGASGLDLLNAAPWLRELLPIDQLTTTKLDPSALETFTSTQSPLETFSGVRLPKGVGTVMVMGRTTRRVSTPVAVDYNAGFGRITVLTADLDDDLFATWPERLDLMTLLTGNILVPQQQQTSAGNSATAYDDLAGQTRATLDQFDIKRRFGFSLVSLILMALIAAIGPLDYLLINRFFGRPLLGWLTFPVVVIAISALLAAQSRPAASASSNGSAGEGEGDPGLRCNRIEIVDVDVTAKIGRGFQASYLYSHDAALVDLQIEPSSTLTAITDSTEQRLVAPFGYPGESFGGIQIAIEDSRLPSYEVPFVRAETTEISKTDQSDSKPLISSILGAPLASRSSKGIAAQLQFTPDLPGDGASMQRRSGSELLQGELVNPLPFDILDGMLVYRNWAYLLPTRFPARGRIAQVDSLRQKNFRWQLSRQKALESSSESEAWNPASTDSLQRVTEMLMFHSAVGGSRYTGLTDGPLDFLDLSHVLSEDRCMLIGRVADEFMSLRTTVDGEELDAAGESLTMIRVVLPVVSRVSP